MVDIRYQNILYIENIKYTLKNLTAFSIRYSRSIVQDLEERNADVALLLQNQSTESTEC